MSSFLNIPNYSWQSAVDTAANLPSGGAPGDARITLDTYQAYVYNGSVWIPLLSATGANIFTIIQTDTGTYPTADAPNDTLTFTTNNLIFAEFNGDSTTDTVTLDFAYTPENIVNKSINLLSPDNIKYPTTLAVSQGLFLKQNVIKTEVFTLNSGDILSKFITLTSTPQSPESVTFFIKGGIYQINGIDFDVTGNIVNWGGMGLDGFLEIGDIVVIQY